MCSHRGSTSFTDGLMYVLQWVHCGANCIPHRPAPGQFSERPSLQVPPLATTTTTLPFTPKKKKKIQVKKILELFLPAFARVNLYDYWLEPWKRNLHLEPAPFILLALPAYIQASLTDKPHSLTCFQPICPAKDSNA